MKKTRLNGGKLKGDTVEIEDLASTWNFRPAIILQKLSFKTKRPGP